MTPDTAEAELAVVQAAMAYREKLLANPRALDVLTNANNPLTPALSEIARVTHQLAVARGEVKHAGADGSCPDYGSHLDPCPPGCASGTCVAGSGKHAPVRVPAICVCSRTEKMYCAAPDCHGGADLIEEPELVWVTRTWADVRAGDHVRMPGSDATAHVQSAVHLRWHVKPGTGTSQYNPPQPLEWSGVRVMLETGVSGDAHQYEMDPAKPIEIEINKDFADCLAVHAFTWADRAGLVTE